MPEAALDRIAKHVLDSLLEGCQVIGFDWTYLYVNDTVVAQGRKSRDELLGRTMTECYPGIDETPMFTVLRRCMTDRTHERMENEFDFPDGSKGWFELRFIPVPEGTCILSLDITAQKRSAAALARTEEQLRHAQKMEAVGRLAGGVAHDFNNLLSVILSYTSMLLDDLRDDDPMRQDIDEIKRAGDRAADLTRQLLALSRRQVLEPGIIDLNEVVVGVDRMVRRLLGEDVTIRTCTAPNLGLIEANPGQLEQVLLNLVTNARDAMPRGGTLTIETQNVDLDDAYADAHLDVMPGRHVMLAVSDTGVGMDKATLQRIFEPFFTTKEKGKGTGLGLSTVFGIVRQSGGNIWVYSEPGKGTTFKVYFPQTDKSPRATPPIRIDAVRGNETILLVEDEDQVRTVARGILGRYGYDVLEASNGGEALKIARRASKLIHLLLTDIVMPEMGGRDLAQALVPDSPGMRVLFMSGYTEEATGAHGVLSSGFALLQKPFTPKTLLRRVREVLDSPPT